MEDFLKELKIAKTISTSENDLVELLKSEYEKVRYAVVSNESFSLDTQIALAIDSSSSIEVLQALSRSSSELVRNHISANNNCPLEIIEIFVSQKDALMGIASNTKAPEHILELLLDCHDGRYKEFLARNQSTPVYILEQLHNYYDEDVRIGIAKNPMTPLETLILQSKDESTEVRYALLYNKNFPEALIKDFFTTLDETIKIDFAKDLLILTQVLTLLSRDQSDNVKYELFYNKNFTNMISKDFVLSLNEETKIKVVKNQSTTSEALNILVYDDSFTVKREIILREGLSSDIVEVLAKDKDSKLRLLIAKEKRFGKDILSSLLADEDLLVSQVAKSTLESLDKDLLPDESYIDEETMNL